ncbi:MAG: 2OG-Fe(II) oxygenase [Steroidobacteraceae bacterium]
MTDGSPAIRRAQELDAAGRHDDAINELAHAAQAGDYDAMTVLAKRIIIGDRAPRLMPQGFSLLNDAAKLGSAEAAERMAVVSASGITGTSDWPAALKLLVLAAERGWAPAHRQLAVLASLTATIPAGSAGSELRSPGSYLQEIDLRALLAPPAPAVLHADPLVRHFPGFLNRHICDWLIERARGKLTRALVYDVATQKDVAHKARTNSFAVFHNMEADLVHLAVQSRIAAACGQPLSHLEASTVLHYALGEEIVDHYDFVDPEKPGYQEDIRRSGYRVATFLLYLNAEYEGGETVFPKFGLSFRGQTGDGLCFLNTHPNMQADVRTLHSGRAPTVGEKWVFSQFVRNRPGVSPLA